MGTQALGGKKSPMDIPKSFFIHGDYPTVNMILPWVWRFSNSV